jgi:hypothetical protein
MKLIARCLLSVLCLAAGSAVAATKTYALPDTLTVTGNLGGIYTYGITNEIVDHSFDGQTIKINSITATADGNASDVRVNFDWEFWFNNAPMGLTPGGAQTSNTYASAATIPATYFAGWHFVDGNTVLGTTGPFQLSGTYDFNTQSGSSTPIFGYTVTANSTQTQIINGLYLQVAGFSGDLGFGGGNVNFTMSNIQVTIDYTVVAQAVVTPTPSLAPWMLVLLASLVMSMTVLSRRQFPSS